MDADLGSAQDKKTGPLSVSELRARLDAKLQTNKDELEQDESSKSSIRSLDSSFENPEEEVRPIMKRISQFQAQNVQLPALATKGSLAHSRTSSAQPVQAVSCPAPESTSEQSNNDAVEKGPKKFLKRDSSNQSPIPSPSVAALRSQLALNPAMLKPGESGRVKASRTPSGQSADFTSASEVPSNAPTVEIPKTPSSSSGLTPSPLRASSRVSDIQQRLALDPNALLPSPLSGPPSRGHRRGKSSAAPTPTAPTPEVTIESQLNRPAITTKARRSRTSAKFSCDDESTQMLEDIERMTTQLDDAALLALQAEKAEQNVIEKLIAESNNSVSETPSTESSNCTVEKPLQVVESSVSVEESITANDVRSSENNLIPEVSIEERIPGIAITEDCINPKQIADDNLGIERLSRNCRHRTMDSGLNVFKDVDPDLVANIDNALEKASANEQAPADTLPQAFNSNCPQEKTLANQPASVATIPQDSDSENVFEKAPVTQPASIATIPQDSDSENVFEKAPVTQPASVDTMPQASDSENVLEETTANRQASVLTLQQDSAT